MKTTILLEPIPAPGGGGTTAPAVTPTSGGNPVVETRTGTGFNPPQEEDDGFLEPTVAPTEEAPKLGADGKPIVVVDPAAPKVGADGKPIVEAPAAPVVPQQFDAASVAALLAEHSKQVAAPVAPAPKPLTPAELDAKLNTYRPTEVDAAEMLSDDPKIRLTAMNRMGSALVKNAVTVANIIADDKINKFMATLQPHIEFAQQQQAAMYTQNYFTDHPTHVGLDPLIAQVAQQMTGEAKWKNAPQKDTMAEVGKRVDALVARLKIPTTQPVVAGAAPVVQTTVQPARTRMSTTTSGGQGGAGGAGGAGDKDPEASIWN